MRKSALGESSAPRVSAAPHRRDPRPPAPSELDRTPDPISRLPASPPPCESISLSLPLPLPFLPSVLAVTRGAPRRAPRGWVRRRVQRQDAGLRGEEKVTVHGSDYVLKLPRRTPPGGPPPGSRRAAALSRSRSPVQTALQVPARGSKRGCEEPATTSRKACPAPAGPPGGPDRRRKGFPEGLTAAGRGSGKALQVPAQHSRVPCRRRKGFSEGLAGSSQGLPESFAGSCKAPRTPARSRQALVEGPAPPATPADAPTTFLQAPQGSLGPIEDQRHVGPHGKRRGPQGREGGREGRKEMKRGARRGPQGRTARAATSHGTSAHARQNPSPSSPNPCVPCALAVLFLLHGANSSDRSVLDPWTRRAGELFPGKFEDVVRPVNGYLP